MENRESYAGIGRTSLPPATSKKFVLAARKDEKCAERMTSPLCVRNMRNWCSGSTSDFQSENAGSTPVFRSKNLLERRKNMNKEDLVVAVANRLDVPKSQAVCAVNAVFGAVAEALVAHDTASIPGFGKFAAKYCPSRQSRNPKTGETVEVPQHFVVRFAPAKALKDAVK